MGLGQVGRGVVEGAGPGTTLRGFTLELSPSPAGQQHHAEQMKEISVSSQDPCQCSESMLLFWRLCYFTPSHTVGRKAHTCLGPR